MKLPLTAASLMQPNLCHLLLLLLLLVLAVLLSCLLWCNGSIGLLCHIFPQIGQQRSSTSIQPT